MDNKVFSSIANARALAFSVDRKNFGKAQVCGFVYVNRANALVMFKDGNC